MMASDSVYSNHATSSRRGSSSRSESTWSRQWNEEEPGPAVVDVATQVAGYHFAKSQVRKNLKKYFSSKFKKILVKTFEKRLKTT